jgi:hypothetical protein
MAQLARALAAPRELGDILTGVTTPAVQMIPGADAVGLLLVQKGGEFESLAGTHHVVAELDKLQIASGEGPVTRPPFTKRLCAAKICAASSAGPGLRRAPSSTACSAPCRSSCTPPTATPAR